MNTRERNKAFLKKHVAEQEKIYSAILSSVKEKEGKKAGFKYQYVAAAVLLFTCLLLSLLPNFGPGVAIKVNAEGLMQGYSAHRLPIEKPSEAFVSATQNLSLKLLKQCSEDSKNVCISPTSIMFSLGLAANGATEGQSLDEFCTLLGMNENELNSQYRSYMLGLLKDKSDVDLGIANSIWVRNGFPVNPNFLQANADYYNAFAYQRDFAKPEVVQNMNDWVKDKTLGKIDNIVDSPINPNVVMYLINTVYFKGDWMETFYKSQSYYSKFSLDNVKSKQVLFMHKESTYQYFKGNDFEGALLPYKGDRFAFAAILPNEGIDPRELLSRIGENSFFGTIKKSTDKKIQLDLPSFHVTCDKDLIKPLQELGLKTAFNKNANGLNRIGDNIYISKVKHKTDIEVGEKGTIATAAFSSQISAHNMEPITKTLKFNRPFLYAIMDSKTNLPLFIGVMDNPN